VQIPLLVSLLGLLPLWISVFWLGQGLDRAVADLEREQAETLHQHVLRLAEEQRSGMVDDAKRLGGWGELAVFLAHPDPYWGDANLGKRLLNEGGRYSFVAVIGEDGWVFYSAGADFRALRAIEWPLAEANGYAISSLGVAAVTTSPIRPDPSGVPRGAVVLGRVFDDGFVADLEKIHGVRARFEAPSPLPARAAFYEGGLVRGSLELDSGGGRSESTFQTKAGKPVLRLLVEHSSRPVKDLNRHLRWLWLALLIFSGFLMAGLVWVLHRTVYRPLAGLVGDVHAIRRTGAPHGRARLWGPREVRELAASINELMVTLEMTRASLVQSEKLSSLGELVAGVAHELNNPLTTVIGYAELAIKEKGCGEEIRRDLEMINEGARRAAQIVRSLLAFARNDSREKTLVGVNGVLEKVLGLTANQIRLDNIEIRLELAPGSALPMVKAHDRQLQQVFLNLVNNAHQAMASLKRPGILTVKTEHRNGMVLITVADTGPGISKADLTRIFDPFFTTKPVGQGTGLGLSVSYGIVQEHGGKIRAESEEGHGATFVVELPVISSADLEGSNVVSYR
jgi:signal transduction histidine kinase